MTMRLFLMCCELFVAMLCHHVECSDWGTGLFCVVVVVTGDNFPLLHSTAFLECWWGDRTDGSAEDCGFPVDGDGPARLDPDPQYPFN